PPQGMQWGIELGELTFGNVGGLACFCESERLLGVHPLRPSARGQETETPGLGNGEAGGMGQARRQPASRPASRTGAAAATATWPPIVYCLRGMTEHAVPTESDRSDHGSS